MLKVKFLVFMKILLLCHANVSEFIPMAQSVESCNSDGTYHKIDASNLEFVPFNDSMVVGNGFVKIKEPITAPLRVKNNNE